jgi:hypothetical protein
MPMAWTSAGGGRDVWHHAASDLFLRSATGFMKRGRAAVMGIAIAIGLRIGGVSRCEDAVVRIDAILIN